MGKIMKKIINYILYLFVFIIVLDFFIFRMIFGFGIPPLDRYGYNNNFRQPMPYVNFACQGLLEGKTSYDKTKFFKTDKKDAIKVAFFGGSTGMPISEEYFAERLSQLFNKKNVIVKNFSCASLHHRHHLHMILEFLPKYNPDIVIFYGGANEGAQHILYDPRPGYPYNFYYRGETSTLRKFLIEYSAIFSTIEDRYGTITNYRNLNEEYKPGSEEWSKDIVYKYFETLELAKNITETLNSNNYGHTKFIAFYQPYKEDEVPEIKFVHKMITDGIKEKDYIFDIHSAYDKFDDSIWDDFCHVGYDENSEPNKHIVDVMAETVAKKFPIK